MGKGRSGGRLILAALGLVVLAATFAACGSGAGDSPAMRETAGPAATATGEGSGQPAASSATPTQRPLAQGQPTPTTVVTQGPGETPTSTPTAPPTATAESMAAAPPTPAPAEATPAPVAEPTATARPEPTVPPSVGLRREFAVEMLAGELDAVEADARGEAIVLAETDGRFAGSGTLTSEAWRPGFPFDDLVLSWNAKAPPGTSLRFEARVNVDGEWSRWYVMGTWSHRGGASARGQTDAIGEVAVDNLKLRRPADLWQYRVILATEDPAATPLLLNVSVAVADRKRVAVGPMVEPAGRWVRELHVPVESQAIQDPSVAWEICSPTSLTMVLRYYGIDTALPTIYRGVRDATTGIYGNWPLNTALAAEYGFDAYVERMYSLDQIRAHIAAGRPIIISVRYQPGELEGAPLRSTSGHIMLVRGFTDRGQVIVNDPAAANLAGVRRVLSAEQLEKVWLRSGGIAYVVSPRP